jgi:Protein of unknwon function (DUF3310)
MDCEECKFSVGHSALCSKDSSDSVNHPKHYNSHPAGIEAITVIEHFTFNLGSAIKYVWRHGLKPGADAVEDLKKARWYIEREIARLEGPSKVTRPTGPRFFPGDAETSLSLLTEQMNGPPTKVKFLAYLGDLYSKQDPPYVLDMIKFEEWAACQVWNQVEHQVWEGG